MQSALSIQQRPQLGMTAKGLHQCAGRPGQTQHAQQQGLKLLLVLTVHIRVLHHIPWPVQPRLDLALIPLQHHQGRLAMPDQGLEQSPRLGLQPLGALLHIPCVKGQKLMPAIGLRQALLAFNDLHAGPMILRTSSA